MATDTPLQCHEGRKQIMETDLDNLCPFTKDSSCYFRILTTLDMKFRSGVSSFCKRNLMDFQT